MSQSYSTRTSQGLQGEIQVGPDKSISHRSLIFSAIAQGESRIRNLLLGEDVLRTLTILNQLGVVTSHQSATIKLGDELTVKGVGLFGFKQPDEHLYCGNSGTTMRLMHGLLAGQSFSSVLTGDDSLDKRPMDRVIHPLEKMGARIKVWEEKGKRFIRLGDWESGRRGEKLKLRGIEYKSPVASAQVKTALLIAGMYAEGETVVTEPYLSRNHTELMLQAMGAPIRVENLKITISTAQSLQPLNIDVPGDISSAAFFIVAALILPKSHLILKNICLNPTRTGLLDVLLKMGADIKVHNQHLSSGETIGDLEINSSQLKNISIEGDVIPRLIDEIPILALAAVFADGDFIVSDARELRFKETDRIKSICLELHKMGVDIVEKDDGFVVRGLGTKGTISIQAHSVLKSYGDHRMAMMEIIAGLKMTTTAKIDDVSCVQTSFPQFFELLESIS